MILNHFGAAFDAAKAVKLAAQGQISFKDFFRWLRENISISVWFDEVRSRCSKIAMVLGSYLSLVLRVYPFGWTWSLSGLIAGSSGLFFQKDFIS